MNQFFRGAATLLSAICWVLTYRCPAQDVREYQIVREDYFTQATTNRAATDADLLHELYAYAFPAYAGAIISASFSSPQGWTLSLTNTGTLFASPPVAGETLNLPASARAGRYHFDVAGTSGAEQGINLSLPGPAVGIPPVRISNFPEAQSVDATEAFAVQWDKIARRTPYDYATLNITTNSVRVYTSSSITLDQTSVTLPTGTLEPNTTYSGFLHLHHYIRESGRSANPHWILGEDRVTRFSIKTINPAGVFRFSPSCVTVNEGEGTATMTVERTQGAESVATVGYFSTDGTARAGTNYESVSGTLTFAPGVTKQTFPVQILDDGSTNPPLTVHFGLTNATGGAGLATHPHAGLTIMDSLSSPGQNAEAFLLARVEFYSQTSAAAPIQSSRSATSRFFASVHPAFPGGVTNATVKLPDGSIRSLGRLFSDYRFVYDHSEDFPSRTAMDKTFHGGKYVVSFDTLTDGSFSETLNLGVERNFSVAQLTNWDASQNIDPAQPFTLNWLPFAGAGSNDCVAVIVEDESSEYLVYTPVELEDGALPGTTTSFEIPAGLLQFGKRYLVNIIFVKMANSGPHPDGRFRSGIASVHTTVFDVNTAPGP
jgi:hypothetical protein